MDEGKREVTIPEGMEILLDIGGGIVVARIDINIIREQDKNAHMMKPEMFRQLSENIKNRGALESLPFCALTDKIEVVSGHHRLRASKEAGLTHIYALVDITGLTRSQIAAKQIAHNAINGFDDPSMLKEIAKLITEVDDLIESYIGKEVLGEPTATLEKMISPLLNYDWKEIMLTFLPHQVRDMEALVKATAGKKELIGIAHVEQYEQLVETLQKYQSMQNIKNVSTAIHSMIEAALEKIEDSGYNAEQGQWIPLSKIFGAGAIPLYIVEELNAVEKIMKGQGIEFGKAKYKMLEVLIEHYLRG